MQEEYKFKKGDTVRRTTYSNYNDGWELPIGAICTVLRVTSEGWIAVEYPGVPTTELHCPDYFVLVEEDAEQKTRDNKYDMKNESWFIKIKNKNEFKAVSEWLSKNFGAVPVFKYTPAVEYLTNTTTLGEVVPDMVFWASEDQMQGMNADCKEISCSFKFVVDSVIMPEITEKDLKIKELKAEIDKMNKKLEALIKE